MSKVIAITNPKGGSGKTTVTINLAAALVLENSSLKVCIVDLDGVASTTFWLLHKRGQEFKGLTIVDALLRKKPMHLIKQEVRPNMFVIPSSIELERAESKIAIGRIKEVLLQLHDMDYIFLDLGQGFNNVHRAAMYSANSIYISAEIDWLSM